MGWIPIFKQIQQLFVCMFWFPEIYHSILSVYQFPTKKHINNFKLGKKRQIKLFLG